MKRLIGILSFLSICYFSNAKSDTFQENKKNAKLEQIYFTNKKLYQKCKKNKALEKKYIDTTLTLAHFFLTNKMLPPKIKYPRALNLYREVLIVNPKHSIALKSKHLIESIYKSMNRPIPK